MTIQIDLEQKVLRVKKCDSDALTFHFAADSVGVSLFYAIPKHSNYIYATLDENGIVNNQLAYRLLTERGYSGEIDLVPVEIVNKTRFVFPEKKSATDSELPLFDEYNKKFVVISE